MKIIIFMSSLNVGGAERVATSLANYLSSKDIDIYLISFNNLNSSYPLNEKVKFINNIDKVTNRIKGFKQRLNFMISTFDKINPDLIFTMNYKMTYYVLYYKYLLKHKNVKIVSSERCHPNSKDKTLIDKILNYFSSRKCDGFIFQTERVKELYNKKVQHNSIVIHNPVSNPEINEIINLKIKKEKIITSMGRLEEQKAQDIMIKAFKNVKEKYPDYKLIIYGEGSCRKNLEQLINDLDLEDNVFLPGINKNALYEVAKSQIFLLTSNYEGMPNALLEAMAAGVCSISTDCEMGPRELIKDGQNGFLVKVGDIKKISELMIKLIENNELRIKVEKEAKKILETHSCEYIFEQYLDYFKFTLRRKTTFKERLFKFVSKKGFLNFLPDKIYLKLMYHCIMQRKLCFKNPQTFNEKLQWLKINDRKKIYTTMVDKIKVKDYIKDVIGSEYIVPTIGVYNSFDEINFSELPSKFVIKCSHDSGGVIIVKDKNNLDIKKAKEKIERHLKTNFYYHGREWPYKNVEPKILIEKYIGDNPNDYKFMCFNGKVKCSFVCSERHEELKVTFFDLDWNKMPFERHYPSSKRQISKPKNYQKMIELSEKISKDLLFARIDFYEIDGKIYFGEITFYPGNGTEEFTPEKYDYLLGSWLNLPNDKK